MLLKSGFCEAVLGLTRAFKAIASEARLAPALVGSQSVQAVSMVAALLGASCTLIMVWNCEKAYLYLSEQNGLQMTPRNELVYLTYTVIFAINIFQIVAVLALAEVAAEGVHALPVVRAEVLPSYTFIDICKGRKSEDILYS